MHVCLRRWNESVHARRSWLQPPDQLLCRTLKSCRTANFHRSQHLRDPRSPLPRLWSGRRAAEPGLIHSLARSRWTSGPPPVLFSSSPVTKSLFSSCRRPRFPTLTHFPPSGADSFLSDSKVCVSGVSPRVPQPTRCWEVYLLQAACWILFVCSSSVRTHEL